MIHWCGVTLVFAEAWIQRTKQYICMHSVRSRGSSPLFIASFCQPRAILFDDIVGYDANMNRKCSVIRRWWLLFQNDCAAVTKRSKLFLSYVSFVF